MKERIEGTAPAPTTRPKTIYQWKTDDVEKWLSRRCPELACQYGGAFRQHEITGRALVHMNEGSLLQLGITDLEGCSAIWREILKLRLKTDILEMKEIENSKQWNHWRIDS
ncbi:unnamed protein product [Darwinula stevensoni]|uniref:SAM domain-containing protein n=1 Tax=Darwinula stevensoni TaxID=69355 RepID=A0A7R9FQN9_9CRUS|nr:unnamed protein product [Darwinula stevensoni]CAG0900136.1 unnamed protein product [Darwinula stevensoni]